MILVIDTAGSACSCALFDGTLVAMSEHLADKGHAEMIVPQIEALFDQAKFEPECVKKIIVTTGPGSFTGVRVGVSAARGMALALGCDIYGITCFEGFAAQLFALRTTPDFPLKQGDKFCVMIDARKGQIYTQEFIYNGVDKIPTSTNTASALDIRKAQEHYAGITMPIIGSGAFHIEGREGFFTQEIFRVILAKNICGEIEKFLDANPQKPAPFYIRAPDAKPVFAFLDQGF